MHEKIRGIGIKALWWNAAIGSLFLVLLLMSAVNS